MKLWIVVSSTLLAVGCSTGKASPPLESPEAARIRALEARVAALETVKPAHQYQLSVQGFRTFRFDPATGESCLQFTTVDDWKTQRAKEQSCDCFDRTQEYDAIPNKDRADEDRADRFYRRLVAPACGEKAAK